MIRIIFNLTAVGFAFAGLAIIGKSLLSGYPMWGAMLNGAVPFMVSAILVRAD